MIDVTLACEYANSKLVDVVTVSDADDGSCLLQIWELRFGHNAKPFFQTLSTRFGQDFEVFAAGVWPVFFLLMFCRGFEVESWSRL